MRSFLRLAPGWLRRVLMGTLLATSLGCGLQDSFRRPKQPRPAESKRSTSWHRGQTTTQTGYVRAYSAWLADHDSLKDRLTDSPQIVNEIYGRVINHLVLMTQYMYAQESTAFQEEVVKAYQSLMSPWPNGINPEIVRRRLESIEARIHRSFRPGKFPLKRPEESEKEDES